jgi:hypothetical protein
MSAGEMAQRARQSNPTLGHEGLLQHLNANQHQLDPQSQQQLQGINRAFQRERFGLPQEPARGYPETLRNADTYRPSEGGYIGPQQRAPVGGSERQAAGLPSGSQSPQGRQTAQVARTSQGQPVRQGTRAVDGAGRQVEFNGRTWEPVQQSQQPQRGGRQGQQSKKNNPFSRAAQALKPHALRPPRLNVRPMRPIKRFHAY